MDLNHCRLAPTDLQSVTFSSSVTDPKIKMVVDGRFELPQVSLPDPKSGVAANYTNRPLNFSKNFQNKKPPGPRRSGGFFLKIYFKSTLK